MFGVQSSSPAPEAEPAPAQTAQAAPEAPVPAKQNFKMLPVLMAVIVLLLAAIVVLIFTMRK
jgi:3-oxoacyl-ACP reductase-like protein